jgi:hypothetical protein
MGLRCSLQLSALPTEAFEVWFLGHHGVTALLADKPAAGFRQHAPEIVAQHAVRTANDLLSHVETSAPSPSAFALSPRL